MNIYRGDRSSKINGRRQIAGRNNLPLVSGRACLPALVLAALLALGCYPMLAQTASTPLKGAHSPGGDVKNGKRVFAAERCGICHGISGQGASQAETAIAGPRISPPEISFSAFAAFVRKPRGQMPAYNRAKVSDAELADVYAFLKSTEPSRENASSAGTLPAGNAENGKKFYTRDGCYECHGRHAEGSTATGPRLTPPPLAFEQFVSYVRHPMGNMPPYTSKVVSDAELADIFAFLRSLPPPPKVETIPLLKLK